MKHKVGDRVKIRKDLIVNEIYGYDAFVENMKSFLGKWVTIAKESDSHMKYYIEEDGERWAWTDEMFEDDVVESEDYAERKRVDVGYYLEHCGHRVIENVYYRYNDSHDHVFCVTVGCTNQYMLPIKAIEFIIPHED